MNISEATKTVATEYNGWSNRETWIVNLWMTGDQGYYEQLCEIISSHDDLSDQAEWLEMMLRYELDDEIDKPCLWQDLLQCAFGRINWSEIIENNIE